jgi:hypothetical protein
VIIKLISISTIEHNRSIGKNSFFVISELSERINRYLEYPCGDTLVNDILLLKIDAVENFKAYREKAGSSMAAVKLEPKFIFLSNLLKIINISQQNLPVIIGFPEH